MAALAGGCIGTAAVRKFLLKLMAPAEGRDRYGLGSMGPDARWIGSVGKGREGNRLARQVGVFYTRGGAFAVAMFALPFDGSPKTGKAMLSEIAKRLDSRFGNQALREHRCPRVAGLGG
jgi:hypothetical protein